MKHVCIVSVVIFFIAIITSSAMALGLGAYVSGSGGKAWHQSGRLTDGESTGLKNRFMKGYPSVAYGGGILLDTDPDTDGIFNYRLNIGYERANVLAANRIDLNRMNFINTFGFRLFRNDAIKLWFGPQFGINYCWGNESRTTYDISPFMGTGLPGVMQGMLPITFKRKYSLVGFSGGLALGMNFNLDSRVTLSIEAGCRGYLTATLKPIEGNPPSGKVNGVEGYLLFGVLGRVN